MNIYEYTTKHGAPTVGLAVAVDSRLSSRYNIGKIVKITATGQITVESAAGRQSRFTAEGRGIGHNDSLEFDVEWARRQNTINDARQAAMAAINRIPTLGSVRSRYSRKEEMNELLEHYEQTVAAARAALNAIPDDEPSTN